ncbi:MAG TPA: bifunctional 5,10-methylenetetrahydrofolate dehydrogenase/5,10-methenyltetrahydrofolate cyclohydrolase [Methanolinea sp.]|jgi:methylenetetrahydrofolate dehydrogenase (NADP+)/methenyltetrahydrofolate cyclohydrolase|nr:bifunctional 5,10-methylenetetrahydrofolate dehydrogenase/5,10-methenyltetrahydrofolate cyclohydrolase [Methanolinea sp.]HOS81344.1 bifunctional 5,10-methylenetetrahydrofolate dehydrogenase/5,10-methenyltetrahydrofolate cyclohydrolase [Methanolinea sp.]HPC54668.1 bifunctional 5,10-methylenetetrahydrofolate dehydrogenase/5,10-methenyltetrahydrofolate cyclohydrolase [Methanolinea sp.]HQE85034.1 bifunctional 5,10-methylenetetrahydrofolate dehydrogenase/5,10-methenyltetrahydrofolate cyclohydrolas
MILDGKRISEERLAKLKEEIRNSGLFPSLATVIVGDDPASRMYVRMKHRACEAAGIRSVGVELPSSASTKDVLGSIENLNSDPGVNGILVQLPLPSHIDTPRIVESVDPRKDVDGFHPYNMGCLFLGTPVFSPCTPAGIMTLLSAYGVEPGGMHAVVLGRSIEVGRPMAALLLNAHATVTICHSRTRDLPSITQKADILVVAVGKPKFIGPQMVREGAIVVDVGTNRVEGILCGDVDFERVRDVAGAITPVPGGVGPMTIATLMENTFLAARIQACTDAR